MTRRSWVDALFSAIDRVPGPPWLGYAVLTAVFGVTSVALRVVDGTVDHEPINPVTTAYAAFTVLPFAVSHYLSRAAARSLDDFRPALGDLEPRYDEFRRRLTTMPVWASVVAPVLGVGVWLTGQTFSVQGWGITENTSLLTNVVTAASGIILNVGLAIFVARCLRQAAVIVYLHRESTAIRLWETAPHVAFSRLTFAMAVSLTVPYTLALALALALGQGSVVEVVVYLVCVILVLALFVLPLNGMHRRLLREKARRLTESNRAFEVVGGGLREAVESDELGRVGQLTEALTGLRTEQDRIRRFSTWPWAPETIRGLLTSLGLPVLLWVITTLLGRLF